MSNGKEWSALPDAGLWDRVLANRLCILVTGSEKAARDFVDALGSRLPQPVIHISCDEHVALDEWDAGSTVVLHDIDTLSVTAQWRLLERLDAILPHTQVISTSSRPLVALVTSGDFLAILYYRLNIIHIELD
jgi:hypothetical protein